MCHEKNDKTMSLLLVSSWKAAVVVISIPAKARSSKKTSQFPPFPRFSGSAGVGGGLGNS